MLTIHGGIARYPDMTESVRSLGEEAVLRRLALITLVMLALLPLRWFTVIATPAGTLYLYEVGLVLLAAVALLTLPTSVFAQARDETIAFTLVMVAGFAVWAGACLFAGVSLASTVKQVGYLGGFIVV